MAACSILAAVDATRKVAAAAVAITAAGANPSPRRSAETPEMAPTEAKHRGALRAMPMPNANLLRGLFA